MGRLSRWLRRRRGSRARPAPLERALLATLDRNLAGAEEALREAAAAEPGAPAVHLALGRIFRQRGEIGRAIQIHQNLLVRRDLPDALRTLALADLAEDFRQGGFLRRAMAAYEEVLARDPRHPTALRTLAGLLADTGDYDRALEMVRRLRRIDRGSADALVARLGVAAARAAHAEGRDRDARRRLRRVLRRVPDHPDAWILLGHLMAERGRNRAALEAWKRAREAAPHRAVEIDPLLASAYAAVGEPRGFEELLTARLAEHPEDLGAGISLARALAERGERAEALKLLRELVEREPGALDAHAALGRILLEGGSSEERAEALRGLLAALESGGSIAEDTLA